MRLFKGQLGIFNRTFSNDGPSNHTWNLLSWHSNNSITWRWAIRFTKPFRIWLSTQEEVALQAAVEEADHE